MDVKIKDIFESRLKDSPESDSFSVLPEVLKMYLNLIFEMIDIQ